MVALGGLVLGLDYGLAHERATGDFAKHHRGLGVLACHFGAVAERAVGGA
jgi:hypothetical protein